VQILKRLATVGDATTQQLKEELNMSADAVSRHTSKRRRRSYVECRESAGRAATYGLAKHFKTPIHAQLYAIVQAAWGEASSRTSRSPR